jgi:hypothetical protein
VKTVNSFVVFFKNSSSQRTGIAAGGIFYCCQPGTCGSVLFADEIKNFCLALYVETKLLLIVAYSWCFNVQPHLQQYFCCLLFIDTT